MGSPRRALYRMLRFGEWIGDRHPLFGRGC